MGEDQMAGYYTHISQMKRRYFRLPMKFPLEFQLLKYRDEVLEHLREKKSIGMAYDLGVGGLSFISELCLPVDILIRLRFQLPNGLEYKELGKVVRVKAVGDRWQIGVQFVHFGGIRREHLRRFIEDEVKRKTRIIEYI